MKVPLLRPRLGNAVSRGIEPVREVVEPAVADCQMTTHADITSPPYDNLRPTAGTGLTLTVRNRSAACSGEPWD